MHLIYMKTIIVLLITVILDLIKVPDRRKDITKKVALIARKVSSRKPAKEVLNWYKDVIREFKNGKKDSYLTKAEQEIVRDFLEAADLKMPEFTFKKRASELSFMIKKLSKIALCVIKYVIITLVIFLLAYNEVVCDPSIIGVKKGLFELLFLPFIVGVASFVINHAQDR